jgi:hypothetical protein
MMSEDHPRMQAAIKEMKDLILASYPDAKFEVAPGEDPEGIYLTATVDVEDTDEVFDLIVDRLLDVQVEERIPLYVLPVRPIERVIAELHAPHPVGARIGLLLG